MLEKVIVILIVIIAVAGLATAIQRQRKADSPCDNTCSSCPLSDKCEKRVES